MRLNFILAAWLLVGIIGALVLWEVRLGPVGRGCGTRTLTIHWAISGTMPNRIFCEPCPNRDTAEAIAQVLSDTQMELEWKLKIDGFQGKPSIVDVPVSSTSSPFGFRNTRSQFRYLVVGAEWPDGKVKAFVVDLPDLREVQTITVSIP